MSMAHNHGNMSHNHTHNMNNGSMNHNHTHNMNHGNMNHGNGGAMMHMMQMYFYAGQEVTILFKRWKVETTAELVGSMIGLIFLGILYEGIKIGREILKRRAAKRVIIKETIAINSLNAGNGVDKKCTQSGYTTSPPKEILLSGSHFLQTLLHIVQVFVGYLLMLAFMTYNVWVCFAIILGAGLGYFAFGWKSVSVVDIGDHCF
eukprot:gene16202-17832_t